MNRKKWLNLTVDAAILGIGVWGVVIGDWWQAGVAFTLAAFFIWMDLTDSWEKKPKEPEETDALAALKANALSLTQSEEWSYRGYDGDILKKGVEPMPTPGEADDEADARVARDITEARKDGTDIEALSKSESHRRDRPDCRYCQFLDAEKAATDRRITDDSGAL